MRTIVSYCPKCGAPIYVPTVWHGTSAPPNEFTCNCNPQPRADTSTNIVLTARGEDVFLALKRPRDIT